MFTKEINKLKKEGKKMLPGDFTMSEGHGHPLVILMATNGYSINGY